MSAIPSVTIDGNDLTAWLQDRSMSVKRNSFDATFIDEDGGLTAIPALGDVVELDEPAWTGVINSVISTGYRGNVPFYRVHATNEDVLPDAGAAPFNLADTGSRYSSPAGFKDLEVTRILDNAVEEVRSKCIIFKEGVTWGMEIDITSVVEGYTAETFTVMEMTVDWPINDAATYTLDLGKGIFADATTGGGDGGPLDPPTLEDEIGRIAEEHCCDDGGGGPSDSIPLVADAGACDSPTAYAYRYADNMAGTVVDTLGSPASADDVGSWVYYNVAYTSSVFPCALGGGSWRGWNDEQIVLEYDAPADDPDYLGIQTTIDAATLSTDGNVYGYDLWALPADASTVTWANSGTPIAPGVTGATFTVTIPRQFVDWGGSNCLILRPSWECDRPVQFCNVGGSFSSPHVDGRGHSGSYSSFSFDDFCPFTLTAGTEGQATLVPGIGDVDGTNTTFELVSWDGTGGVDAQINGLDAVPNVDYSLDTGAHEVNFVSPPPANSIVLFSYHAVT